MENTDIQAQVLKGLDNLDAQIKAVADDGKASKDAIEKKLAELGAEQVKQAKLLAEIDQRDTAAVAKAAEPRTLGEYFVKSDSYKNYSTTRVATAVFTKDAVTTKLTGDGYTQTSVVAPDVRPGIVGLPDSALVIENLFPHLPTQSDSIVYLKGGALTTNAAAVVEQGAMKPESAFTNPEIKSASVQTVAHWIKITKQLAADAPALAAYINQKMQYGLQSKIDQQLISGNGTSQLPGILTTGNYTDKTADIRKELPTSGATLYDFVLILKSKMEQANVTPTVLLLNPSDWLQVCLLKDGQGNYILGGPQSLASKSLWGVPVVTSASVPSGKYIMANLTIGATIFDRQALTVEMSEHDATNFEQNLITLRVERRLGVAVELPEAIWGGEFALTAAA